MNFLQQTFKFYINSSLHVALAVVSFTMVTYQNFNLPVDSDIVVFVFFSTVVAYNFVKYYPVLKLKRETITIELKRIVLLSLLSIIPLGMILVTMTPEVFLFIVCMGILTLLYVLPFLPKTKNLRDVSGLKIFVIALVWTGTTVVLPFFETGQGYNLLATETMYYALSRFFLIIVLTIPFEIRDTKLDSLYLKTLPQWVGVRSAKVIGVLLSLLSLFFLVLGGEDLFSLYNTLYIVVIGFVLFSNQNNTLYYSAFWVESFPLLWFVSIFIFG
ncbi:prenyltransferase family protein UbiA-like protein [Psychroflexus torquis ATCC 700755]|uniref:Prenyltransferase family protein UbiA-like protein n=1 Tax=Psychroflexus torquis (strain ATCC 700755 / CIP 106069 / ACAM 623) TaxID=313595 RepID=K4IHJ7_PSYTT|nr:prenyltransferase UbiA [Psychroflexus torquis]AFU69288.1 prenyltransferase family protein UbiA-like protein [Psychroflexus torquis ATCC 700755]